jgi:hypothetical protein
MRAYKLPELREIGKNLDIRIGRSKEEAVGTIWEALGLQEEAVEEEDNGAGVIPGGFRENDAEIQQIGVNANVAFNNPIQAPANPRASPASNLAELESRINSQLASELQRLRGDLVQQTQWMKGQWETQGQLVAAALDGNVSKPDQMWREKIFQDPASQEMYDAWLQVGRWSSKVEKGNPLSKDEGSQMKKLAQLWLTKTVLKQEVGTEFANMVGVDLNGTFMEPFKKDIKDAKKAFIKQHPSATLGSVGRPTSSVVLASATDGENFLSSMGKPGKPPVEKRKSCWNCGQLGHVSKDCRSATTPVDKRGPRKFLKAGGSLAVDSHQ